MDIRFEGKHINKGSDTVIIVFQGAFTKLNKDYADQIVAGTVTQESVKAEHSRYHFYKLSEQFSEPDFFFIEDYYSHLYGWYMFDHGNLIIQEFNNKLSEFICKHNYKEVILIGSSKGGVASILYGLINPYVTKIFGMVPDLNISTAPYGESGKKLFFNNDTNFEDNVKDFSSLLSNYPVTIENKKFYYYTGIRDYGFRQLIELNKYLCKDDRYDSHLIIMPTADTHSPLLKGHINLITHIVDTVIHDRPLEDELFLDVGRQVYLSTYPAIAKK
ncbi:hypothetical protein [Listeria rustica]|uniref:Uncharacterized protein n=1 Tax=Listeria rustica TaxID=2713503 RepID=A0A7W1YFE2_9LIST|nr:hypothetical protein [Listeria rustica]MBA3925489.1 hypothetical protein [Listeria rustica]